MDLKKPLTLKFLLANIQKGFLKLSIKRMLPKGTLGREQIRKFIFILKMNILTIAQNPELIDFKIFNKKLCR